MDGYPRARFGPDGLLNWDRTHLRDRRSQVVMSEFAKASGASVEEKNTLSIPWVIVAALLCGVGMFLVTGAVIRLAGGLVNWSWWVGIVPAVLGFLMLLNPRAGSQGAH